MIGGEHVERLEQEMREADAKFGTQWNLSEPEWLSVLAEETGECARWINEQGLGNLSEDDPGLDAELIQVAAVALRWLRARSFRRG